jgi:hypothetical protein
MKRPVALVAVSALLACHAGTAATAVGPMPDIPVYELVQPGAGTPISISRASRDPLAELNATKRVTLAANNADVRTLLLWLAQESGVSLVVSSDVNARVSVTFTDVPAGQAMRAIVAQAGLSLLAPVEGLWPPVVFYHAPVNIDSVTADVIAARFGVSAEMAKWIVESRPRPD